MKKIHLGMMMAAGLLAGCASLTGQSYIDDLNAADLSGAGFSNALAREYRDLANFEWTKMMDYEDGQHHAQKGLAAAAGEVIAPDEVSSRDIPEANLADLTAAHDKLVVALGAGAGERHPEEAAKALSSYDCWLEQQEENHQPDDIAACRQVFEDAYAKIAAAKYTVFFDFGSARLTRAGRDIVAQAATNAKAAGITHFDIVGHTDTVGSNRANLALSKARAAAVRDALVAKGFRARNIKVTGVGESAPLVATADGVKQPENRRSEVISFK